MNKEKMKDRLRDELHAERKDLLRKVPKFSMLLKRRFKELGIKKMVFSNRYGLSYQTLQSYCNGEKAGRGIFAMLLLRRKLKISPDVFVTALEREFYNADTRDRSGYSHGGRGSVVGKKKRKKAKKKRRRVRRS